MALQMQSFAVNGPTAENLPPFSWNDPSVKGKGYAHVGQPATFDFDYVLMKPVESVMQMIE